MLDTVASSIAFMVWGGEMEGEGGEGEKEK